MKTICLFFSCFLICPLLWASTEVAVKERSSLLKRSFGGKFVRAIPVIGTAIQRREVAKRVWQSIRQDMEVAVAQKLVEEIEGAEWIEQRASGMTKIQFSQLYMEQHYKSNVYAGNSLYLRTLLLMTIQTLAKEFREVPPLSFGLYRHVFKRLKGRLAQLNGNSVLSKVLVDHEIEELKSSLDSIFKSFLAWLKRHSAVMALADDYPGMFARFHHLGVCDEIGSNNFWFNSFFPENDKNVIGDIRNRKIHWMYVNDPERLFELYLKLLIYDVAHRTEMANDLMESVTKRSDVEAAIQHRLKYQNREDVEEINVFWVKRPPTGYPSDEWISFREYMKSQGYPSGVEAEDGTSSFRDGEELEEMSEIIVRRFLNSLIP